MGEKVADVSEPIAVDVAASYREFAEGVYLACGNSAETDLPESRWMR